MNIITLPNGNSVTIATYTRAFARLKATPANTLIAGFDYFPARAGDILAKMRDAITKRLNARAAQPDSRKKQPEVQADLVRLAYALRNRRVIRRRELGYEARRIMDARFPERYHVDDYN